jgi:ribose transport system ATP-binding protein
MEGQTNDIVKMINISKNFGGLAALDNVSLTTREGEVHALMGENGAGKSTLIKILTGAYQKDAGEIFIAGKKVDISNPRDGYRHGISVIYQEFALAPHLTVAENIFIDKLSNSKGIINWKKLKTDAEFLMNKLGFENIDVLKPVSELSVAYQQVVEICKALSRDAKVLILDEPTAVLTTSEVDRLFVIINNLKAKGVCVMYVSHRLKEIFTICDRITVLKDGKNVDCVNVKDIDSDRLVSLMIGRSMNEFFPERSAKIGEELFKVENLTKSGVIQDVSFSVRSGEVLGISGLIGSGRTETMRVIFGADKKENGKLFLNDKFLSINSPKQAVKAGVGMLPEDRKNHGVILDMSIRINATLSIIEMFKGIFGFIKNKHEINKVKELVEKLSIKIFSLNDNVSSLSGGNQQKVSLMKWLASNSSVLILDEPTRGVDIGAKVEIYKVINRLAEEGVAIILVSSEMTEIIGMCDRVLVMRQGRVVGEIGREDFSEYGIIKLAMGA